MGLKSIKTFKKTLCVILAIVLLTVYSTVFSACNQNDAPPLKGIPLANQTQAEYSDKTKEFATETIKELLTNVYKLSVNNNISKNTLSLLSTHASEISKITESQGLTENAYNLVFENISDNSVDFAKAFANLYSNKPEPKDVKNLRKFLGLLSSSFSTDSTATIIYHVSDYYYGYLYEKNLKEYQQYGWQYKLDDAEKARENQKTLTQEVTLSNFIPAVKLAFFVGELVLGGAESSSAIDNLTPSEVTLMLKTPDFSTINTSVKGWKLIVSITSKLFLTSAYSSQLFKKFTDSHDLDLVASKLNDVISFMSKIQSKLTQTHAEFLTSGEKNLFIKECFKVFDNQDWQDFENLTAFNFDTDYYNSYAIEYYGVKYTEFYNKIKKIDVITLKNSLDGDFINSLKNYFAGIFPAMFYGVEL